MFKKISTSACKAELCLRGLQAFVLLLALFLWLLHRGNAYQNFFTAEDFVLLTDVNVSDTVSIDEAAGFEGIFLQTPQQALSKGVYRLTVYYYAQSEGSFLSVAAPQSPSSSVRFNDIDLNPGCHTAEADITLSRRVDDLTVNLSFSGSGALQIVGVSLADTGGYYKKLLFYAALLCLALELLFRLKKTDSGSRALVLALAGIFLVSCYPLYTDYIPGGHDIPFHLLRIEGIADGLSSGIFPVKIHPVWAKDYGYAVGVLYGDLLLYFPALLRLLGFSVQSAYKLFVAAVNLGTVLISYRAFRRIFDSRKIGLAGSAMYTLSYYRLADIYTRAAVGEYTAMMFLPLIILGLYLSFAEADRKSWWRHGILTAFGLTGLVQTHILSCEMIGFVILLACLLLAPRIFRRYTFLALSEGALLTAVINIGFLIPFFEYYSGSLIVNSSEWSGLGAAESLQANGLFPAQLFTLFQRSDGGSWAASAGIANEATYSLGILFLIVIALFLYLLVCHRELCRSCRLFGPALLCTALGCLLAFMSTCLFPWDDIAGWGGVAQKLVNSLQFPWRLLEPATALLTFSGCFVLSAMSRFPERDIVRAVLTGALVLSAVNVGWYMYDLMFTREPYRAYNTCDLNTMALYSYEYLPQGTDPNLIRYNFSHWENIGGVEAYEKHGTSLSCRIVGAQPGGFADFPLIAYPHYRCVCTDTGEELPLGAGYNNMLRVSFPEAFEGGIEISFREPWYWRLAELVSVLTSAACALLLLLRSHRFVQFVHNRRQRK